MPVKCQWYTGKTYKVCGDGGSLEDELLGLLPGVLWVAEVTVCRSLAVNRLLQVELLHNNTRSKVPVLPDNLDKLKVRFFARAICIDEDR